MDLSSSLIIGPYLSLMESVVIPIGEDLLPVLQNLIVWTHAEELTEARRKLANVEQDLIDLNPDILRAEDAKSDSFREQLGLADQLNQSRSEMKYREMEMSVIEGQANLPNLAKEYDGLIQKQNTRYHLQRILTTQILRCKCTERLSLSTHLLFLELF